jgi:dipeptidase
MCDTFYIPKNLNLYHANILCKNSDREPNEAQSIIHIHHTQHTSDKVKLTYIEIPQVKIHTRCI